MSGTLTTNNKPLRICDLFPLVTWQEVRDAATVQLRGEKQRELELLYTEANFNVLAAVKPKDSVAHLSSEQKTAVDEQSSCRCHWEVVVNYREDSDRPWYDLGVDKVTLGQDEPDSDGQAMSQRRQHYSFSHDDLENIMGFHVRPEDLRKHGALMLLVWLFWELSWTTADFASYAEYNSAWIEEMKERAKPENLVNAIPLEFVSAALGLEEPVVTEDAKQTTTGAVVAGTVATTRQEHEQPHSVTLDVSPGSTH